MVGFVHDVPSDVTAETMARPEPKQSSIPFEQPWPLDRLPDIPTRTVAGRDDRLFPLDFQRPVSQERLGTDIDEVPGGHVAALSRPTELVDMLESCGR